MHTPVRILLLDHSGEIGGAEKSLLAFLSSVDRKRFSLAMGCPLPSPLGRALAQLHVETFDLQYGRPRRQFGPAVLSEAARVLRASARLRHILRKSQPDLVDANTTVAALHATLALRGCETPLTWHVRDLKTAGLVGRSISRRAGAIVPVSEAVSSALAKAGIQGPKVHMIRNGIDPEGFRPTLDAGEIRRKFNLTGDVALVGVVAQLTPWKGHDVLLRAWAEAKRRGTCGVLLIVGSAFWPEDLAWERYLKRLADELGLGGTVRFLGRQDEIASIIGTLTTLVIPSLAEPFGRVALEAMTLGKPVVGTAAGGLPEVVVDGVTGLLVRPGDVTGLAEAIERVLGNTGLSARLGAAGAARVREQFHIRRTTRLTEELYEELLRNGGGS